MHPHPTRYAPTVLQVADSRAALGAASCCRRFDGPCIRRKSLESYCQFLLIPMVIDTQAMPFSVTNPNANYRR